jgi:hypothetical protein
MKPYANWPFDLQQMPNYEYSEAVEDGVIRSAPEIGATMSRPRFTRTRVNSRLSIWVDKEDYKFFFAFFNDQLAQGSLPFNWVHPITERPITYKFSKPPTISTVGPLNWKIDCELEEM